MNREEEIIKASQLYAKAYQKPFVDGALWADNHPMGGALLHTLNKGVEIAKQWKPIPRDKDGLFDETSNLYNELPIIVAEMYGDSLALDYIDKDNWHDAVAGLNDPPPLYYIQCGKLEGCEE